MTELIHRSTRRPSRREVLALGVGAFVVAALPFARRTRRLVRRSVPAMGTVLDIAVVHHDPAYAEAAIDAALTQFQFVERSMTRFTSSSDIGRVNRGAAGDPTHVTPATMHVLQASLRWAAATEGNFDPCIGRAVELWDVAHRREPPPADAVRRVADGHFYRTLELDTWVGHPVARLQQPGIELDLGGIAKGYGVDQAVAALRDWGIAQALVNAGGDLYAIGESDRGDPWQIGVRSPNDPESLIATIPLSDGAIATSGDYFQYFDYHGRRYHHLIDPATGAPRDTPQHTISVRADCCTDADAGATAAFGAPPERAGLWLRRAARGAAVVVHQA